MLLSKRYLGVPRKTLLTLYVGETAAVFMNDCGKIFLVRPRMFSNLDPVLHRWDLA